MQKSRYNTIRLAVIAMMTIAMTMSMGIVSVSALSVSNATAKINVDSTATLRKSASTTSARVADLKDNTKITIKKEIFKSKTSTKASKRWYYVSVSGKTGYVRADLVDSFSYKTTKLTTTDSLNYRVGAGSNMTKKGTLSKGTNINAVLAATPSGGGDTWYKFKLNSKYYYVSGKYLKAASGGSTTNSSTTVNNNEPTTITITGANTPTTLAQGVPFYMTGNVVCNKNIDKVEIGIAKDSKWLTKVEKTKLNSNTFNIASVDSKIKFGSLAVGTYRYVAKFTIGKKTYREINATFNVKKATAPQKIASQAMALVWPSGTDSAKYKFKSDGTGGTATAAFAAALDQAYPKHTTWSDSASTVGAKTGASCDVFVGTVVVSCGYDVAYPRGWDQQLPYVRSSDKWIKVEYTGKESELRSGDICFCTRSSGGHHTCIYVKDSKGNAYLAEAQLNNTYGHLNSKITKLNNYVSVEVYRATA